MLPPPSILGFSRGVAQTEARRVWDAEAGGSSPPTPTCLPEEPRNLLRGFLQGKSLKRVVTLIHLSLQQATRDSGFFP